MPFTDFAGMPPASWTKGDFGIEQLEMYPALSAVEKYNNDELAIRRVFALRVIREAISPVSLGHFIAYDNMIMIALTASGSLRAKAVTDIMAFENEFRQRPNMYAIPGYDLANMIELILKLLVLEPWCVHADFVGTKYGPLLKPIDLRPDLVKAYWTEMYHRCDVERKTRAEQLSLEQDNFVPAF